MTFYDFFKEYAHQNCFHKNIKQENLIQYLDEVLYQLQRPFWKKLLRRNNTLKGLYIYGSVGAGKTKVMDLFFQFFKGTKNRTHFKLFMLDLHKNGYKETVYIYKHIKLLCLDELEILDIADAMIIKKIFNDLGNHGVFILTTTNIQPKDLYKDRLHYDRFEPFIHYIIKNFHIFDLSLDIDYRQCRKPEQKYIEVQDNNQILNVTLIDQNLQTKTYKDGLCINFKNLINPRFGPQHFYDLSKKWHIIYIKDAPYFDQTNTDLLRQFITLVDIYYDQKNKLRIYNKEHLSFNQHTNQPIARLHSRLIDMQ